MVGERGAEIWAKAMTGPENLTLDEQRVIEALLWSFTEQLRSARLLAELGLLDDDEWRLRVQSESGFFLGNRYGRAWWTNYSGGSLALQEDLIQAVNERLDDIAQDYTLDYMRDVLSLIESPTEMSQ